MRAGIVLLVTAWGCGSSTSEPKADAGAPGEDASFDAGPTLGPFEPTPAHDPLPPSFEGPADWFVVEDPSGLSLPEPWPPEGMGDCPADEAHFPGEPGCSLIGTPCPAGLLPDDLPAEQDVLYVLAGATSGDGSADSPFGTIAEAVDAAPAGAVIGIGVGTYVENLQLTRQVTLWGACVAETILRSDVEHRVVGVVSVRGTEATVRNLTIGESARPGIDASGAEATVRLQDVAIEATANFGVFVENRAALEAETLVVRDVRLVEPFDFGRPINVETGATGSVRRAVVRGARGPVVVNDGASLSLRDAAVLDTVADDLDQGWCLFAGAGASLDVSAVVLERCHDVGLLAVGLETQVVTRTSSPETRRPISMAPPDTAWSSRGDRPARSAGCAWRAATPRAS